MHCTALLQAGPSIGYFWRVRKKASSLPLSYSTLLNIWTSSGSNGGMRGALPDSLLRCLEDMAVMRVVYCVVWCVDGVEVVDVRW